MKKSKTYTHIVPDGFKAKSRLRIYTLGLFPYLETGSAVKKALQKRQIKLNDKIGSTGDWVTAGSKIEYKLEYEIDEKVDNSIQTYFEDQDLIVVRKPPGIASSGNSRSLQSQLQSIRIEDAEGSLPFPYLVHRLDKATEGLMLAAKNIQTRRLLSEMFEEHKIIKRYILIVNGHLPSSMKWITEPIDDKPAKTEILESSILKTKDPTSRVIVELHTGRTHQIRRHFKAIGHPIVGDSLYGEDGLSFRTGLLLCAFYLEFVQPNTQNLIKIEYPIPGKISKYESVKN